MLNRIPAVLSDGPCYGLVVWPNLTSAMRSNAMPGLRLDADVPFAVWKIKAVDVHHSLPSGDGSPLPSVGRGADVDVGRIPRDGASGAGSGSGGGRLRGRDAEGVRRSSRDHGAVELRRGIEQMLGPASGGNIFKRPRIGVG